MSKLPSEVEVQIGAKILADTPLIDTPKLDYNAWMGLSRSILEATKSFTATHREHGVAYEELGAVSMHVGSECWLVGVLYRDEKGELFARPEGSFRRRFEKLP